MFQRVREENVYKKETTFASVCVCVKEKAGYRDIYLVKYGRQYEKERKMRVKILSFYVPV